VPFARFIRQDPGFAKATPVRELHAEQGGRGLN